jgi:hypothetical protein
MSTYKIYDKYHKYVIYKENLDDNTLLLKKYIIDYIDFMYKMDNKLGTNRNRIQLIDELTIIEYNLYDYIDVLNFIKIEYNDLYKTIIFNDNIKMLNDICKIIIKLIKN